MMAASGDRQQQVQFVLLHHGHLIGATTAGGSLSESGQLQLQLQTGDEVEVHLANNDETSTNVDEDGFGRTTSSTQDENLSSATTTAVVIECVDATDDEYVECIGLDIDPGEEGDDPGGGGQGELLDGDTAAVVESDVGLQVSEETVISMKGKNNNNNGTTLLPSDDDIHQIDDVESCAASSESAGSVLRTLLQANRRQLMLYQSHKHSSERIPFRGGRTTYSRRRQVLAASTPLKDRSSSTATTVPEYNKEDYDDVDGDDDDDDDGESRAAVARIEADATISGVDSPPASEVVVSQRIDSQIKALLLGHNYVREDRLSRNPASVVRDLSSRRRTTPIGDESSNTKKSRVSDQDDERLLHPLFTEVMKVIAEFSDLNYSVQYGHRSTFLEIRRKGLYGIPSPGQTPVQVIVSDEGIGQFVSVIGVMDEVDCEVRGPTEASVADRFRPLLHKLSIKSGHVYCPGIDPEFADSVSSSILLGMCLGAGPATSKRYRSKECEVWHSLVRDQNNQSNWLALNEGVHKCRECRRLDVYFRTVKKRTTTTMTTTTSTTTATTTATRDNAKRAAIAERTTAIDVQTEQEFICVWGTTEEMET